MKFYYCFICDLHTADLLSSFNFMLLASCQCCALLVSLLVFVHLHLQFEEHLWCKI